MIGEFFSVSEQQLSVANKAHNALVKPGITYGAAFCGS